MTARTPWPILPPLRAAALLVGLALVAATVTAVLHPARPPWTLPVDAAAVPASQLRAWLASAHPPLVLDARPEAERLAGTLPGALPYDPQGGADVLFALVEAWAPDRSIVVFCGSSSCALSREVAAQLRQDLGLAEPAVPWSPDSRGAVTVYYLEGGWDAWNASR